MRERRLAGLGVSVSLPQGWEGRIVPSGRALRGLRFPVLHFGNFALAPGDGTYAQASVQRMDFEKALVAFIEFSPEAAGTALFQSGRWPPLLRTAHLSPNAFPGDRPRNVAANQNFVTVRERAFCVYSVVGFDGSRAPRLGEVNRVLHTLAVDLS